MEKRLKKVVLKELKSERPFEGRRVVLVECHGCETTVREFRVECMSGNLDDFSLDEIGPHVAHTLVFRKARNGRLYPVKKKGA